VLHGLYTAAILTYIALVIFGVSNLVTSVFVESAIMSAKHYRELIVQEKQHAKEIAAMHMKEVFRQVDVDRSGDISVPELSRALHRGGRSQRERVRAACPPSRGQAALTATVLPDQVHA